MLMTMFVVKSDDYCSGYLHSDSCRKKSFCGFWQTWYSYRFMDCLYWSMYLYLYRLQALEGLWFTVIICQLRPLFRAFFLPKYLNQGCFHTAQKFAFISSPSWEETWRHFSGMNVFTTQLHSLVLSNGRAMTEIYTCMLKFLCARATGTTTLLARRKLMHLTALSLLCL